ncbi:DUF6497 family protein [Roseivivax sp. GX 12232]|uniref:DUF6497 family protein n=1 Tax=Roseivivax sp. GX 12232 TaxID=2900547 RepID=UPI001E332B66|nr:DUF6497 family protein [Roseivivax sp. GX 12232]MCE0506757.1 DUF6497 family protein [Roseivivax sp. GX 12232]
MAQEGDGEAEVALPSGASAALQEILVEERDSGQRLMRMRYVDPAITARAEDLEQLSADMDYLCQEVALPGFPAGTARPDRLVISIGSEPSVFGVAHPGITQVFEAYRIEDDRCIWEAF